MSLDPNTEPIIEIDSDLRKITIPESLSNIGVVNDHYAETIYFRIPRYFDGEDLFERNCSIEFVNAAGSPGSSPAVYPAAQPDAKSILFGWEIDSRVTRKAGEISFLVCLERSDGRGYRYGTTPARLTVLPGLCIPDNVTEQDTSILQKVLSGMDDLNVRVGDMERAIASITESLSALTEHQTSLQSALADQSKELIRLITVNKDEISYIKNNAIFMLE